MTSQVVFKTDSKLKKKAMRKARQEGLPFSAVLNRFIRAYVEDDFYLELVPKEFNQKTRRELAEALKDIEEGKNLSPAFDNIEDAIAYLNSVECDDDPSLPEDVQKKLSEAFKKYAKTVHRTSRALPRRSASSDS